MGIVNGTFIYEREPKDGATAKLWEASAFGAPPEFDEAEPGSGQVGATITTGVAYGGYGAYRWTGVPDGQYYASLEYGGHRVWIAHHVEDIATILATPGDMLIRGAADLEALAIDSNGKVMTIVAGMPAWANLEYLGYVAFEQLLNSNDTQRSTTATGYTKLKEIKINANFAIGVRIRFDLSRSGSEGAYGRIYHNGIALGTERERVIDGWETFTEDFVISWNANDLIQIYARASGGYNPIYVRNFRFYYGIVVAGSPLSTTNQDP